VKLWRSDKGNLHREGFPAVDLPHLKQYFWEGKLHRSNGPAVETPSGAMYFWRGVFINTPLWKASDKPEFTLQDVLEIRNVEIRRSILEKVGFGRFEAAATVINTGRGDFTGCVLYELQDPNESGRDSRIRFLKLKNSTPEEDGTYKDYYLRVPPDIKTVPAGIKWSFDVKPGAAWKYLVQT
jgi:hypothetical protein